MGGVFLFWKDRFFEEGRLTNRAFSAIFAPAPNTEKTAMELLGLLMRLAWIYLLRAYAWVNRLIMRPEHASKDAPLPESLEQQKRLTFARHEVGHAWIGWHIAETNRIDHVSVSEGKGDRLIKGHCLIKGAKTGTEAALWAEIAYGLGGIAAETVLSGRFKSAWAQEDLAEARRDCGTLLARFPRTTVPWKHAPRRGIDLGALFVEPLTPQERFVLNQCFDICCTLIERRRSKLEHAAEALAREGRLSGSQLECFFGDRAAILFARLTRSGLITFDP